MYLNEHNIISQSNQRTKDLRRDAAAWRLEHDARGNAEKSASRTFNLFSTLRRFVSIQTPPTTERATTVPTLRRV